MGGKLTQLPMKNPLTIAALLTLAAVLAMGADNAARLERCEAGGRGAAECRLLVLGR